MSLQVMAHSNKNDDKSLQEEKLLKEKLLDEKMRLIRQKNEERLKRQKEIEEDIRNANTHSEEVTSRMETTATRANMSGVVSKDKPAVSKFRGRARGRILEKMSKEEPQAHRFKERQKENFKRVENELKQEKFSPGHGFLSDDRRVDMSKIGSRSVHSWGGSQFEDVVDKVKSRESRHGYEREQNPVINMTGKERLKYQEWKDERSRVDQARQSRQKRGDTWHREWDKDKVTGGRQDNRHDRTRAGERFAERQRHKPDWDLHDDRGGKDNQDNSTKYANNQDQNNVLTHHASSSKDWDVNPKSLPNENKDSATSKEEDWEEETQETPTDITAQNNSDVSYQPNTEDDSTTIKVTYERLQHESTNISDSEPQHVDEKVEDVTLDVHPEEESDSLQKADVECNNDSTGESNITCTSSKENIEEYDQEKVKQETDTSTQLNESASLNSNNNVDSEDTTKPEPKTDNNVTKEENNIERTIDSVSSNKEQDEGTVETTSLKDSKRKENLPKLDLSKTDEEPVPDFLKTPQHKDWADYDFDEEELYFSQDLVYYQ